MKLHEKKKSMAGKMAQKGKQSLLMPKSKTGKNEGEDMMLGKSEVNRS